MTTIRVGTDKYHHQSGPSELTPEFASRIDGPALADLLLREAWHGRCEFIPDYMPPHPARDTRPSFVVRCGIKGPYDGETHYSYLRHSKGPLQGFSWDIYGDNLHTIELAIVALSQAPHPYYTGPIIFKLPIP